MNIYFSYSTKVSNPKEDLSLTKKLAKISVENFKKYYKNVYLITDSNGLEIFKDINFTEVYSILDNINEEYKDVWSIGKLYAIRYIAEKGEQFCHADFDFFITKELPNEILNANVFTQSIEYNIQRLGYNVNYYEKLCKNKYLAENKLHLNYLSSNKAFNCGIIGGKDCSFLYAYSNTAIQMVEDIENKDLWLKNHPEFQSWTKAVLAEQYYLACALKKYNINPTLIFDNSIQNYAPLSAISKKFYKETGAIHLLGKSKQNIEPMLDLILKNDLEFNK
jgi:hypothetical protein